MTYDEKKQILETYMILDAYIDELIEEKDKWYSRALKLNNSEDCKQATDKVCLLEEKINCKIDELVDFREKVNSAINEIDDLILQKILYLKYFKGKPFEKIGEEIGYCTKQISRLHKKAVDLLKL